MMVWRDREIGPVYPGIGSAPDAFLRNEPGDDIFGVPPARHDPRADERGGLDVCSPVSASASISSMWAHYRHSTGSGMARKSHRLVSRFLEVDE